MSWHTIVRFFIIPAFALLIAMQVTNTVSNVMHQKDVAEKGEATIGGSFALTNQDGKTVTSVSLQGKYLLMYFGFSSCPAICPADMALLSQVMQDLGKDAEQIQPVFVTIDPERDTPERLKTYLSNFYPGIIGLTGSQEQIADIANKFHIYAKKVESKDINDYLMDHSAFMYFMDKNGKYITHFNGKQPAEEITAKIRELL